MQIHNKHYPTLQRHFDMQWLPSTQKPISLPMRKNIAGIKMSTRKHCTVFSNGLERNNSFCMEIHRFPF